MIMGLDYALPGFDVATALVGNSHISLFRLLSNFQAFGQIPLCPPSPSGRKRAAQMYPTVLNTVVLLFILPFSFALDCYGHPRDIPLPNLHHCHDLVRAITIASRRPYHNDAKIWGRGLPNNAYTEGLPKTYVYAPGSGPPQTCALDLDADPLYLQAREVFRLQAVATAGARIVTTCLASRSQLGRDPVGPTGHVFAKIVRSYSPVVLQSAGKQSVTIPGMGELLWSSRAGNGSLDDMR